MHHIRIIILLLIFPLLVSLSACGKSPEKEAEEQKKQNEVKKRILEEQREQEETKKRVLLERAGYKEAKWGMSPEEVKKVLRMHVIEESRLSDGDYYIAFDKVKCWFYKNKFYHAKYEPKIHDNDEEGFKAVVNALEEKYGGGRELKDQVDALLGTPLLIYLWEDGLTKIKLRMLDPESFAKYGGGVFPSGTIKIIYESKEITSEKEAEKSQSEYDKVKERAEDMKGDL